MQPIFCFTPAQHLHAGEAERWTSARYLTAHGRFFIHKRESNRMTRFKILIVSGLSVISLGGCSDSGGRTVEVSAGQFTAQNRNQTGPGDAPAVQRLSTEINNNADAGKFIIHWQNAYPSGTVTSRTIEYDKNAGTLTEKGQTGPGISFSNVTDQAIHTVAASGGIVDDLTQHGARRS